MRPTFLFAVTMLVAVPAFAQTGAAVCGTILMSDDKIRCMGVVSGHYVDPGAAGVCQTVLMGEDKIECLRATLDKAYGPEELATCRGILMGSDKAACLASSGSSNRRNYGGGGQQRVEQVRVSFGSDDDDDDDRSSRRRRNRDDDDGDDDRRSRRRRNRDRDDDDDDDRRVRLTNYHRATVTRIYWRLTDERRFHEVDLDNDVAQNTFETVRLPARSVSVCTETVDGFRLFWPKLRRDEALTIAANERNWVRGRCRDLR